MNPQAVYRAVALAAGLVAAAILAQELITVLLAMTMAVILSLPLSSAATIAERRGLPRAAGALAALIVACAGVVTLGLALLPQFVHQAREFALRIPAIVTGAQRFLHALTGAQTRDLSVQLSSLIDGYLQHPDRLLGPAAQVGLRLLEVAVLLTLVVLAAFLIAVNPAAMRSGLLRLLPPGRRSQATEVCERVRAAWIGWLTAVGIDMVVLGGLLFLGLELVGLPFALGFALFSAFLTVIPNYGSIVSAVPPILLGLSQSLGKAIAVTAVYVIVNQIEGNLILPVIMSRRVDLHPALVAIGVLVMAALFGMIGVVIAVPLLSLAIIVVQVLWVEPQERSSAGLGGASARD